MNKEMEIWEKKQGIKSLGKIGIKPGQTILDFGARVGYYSIPAARIVGREGSVYALDKDSYSLNELKRKMIKQGLENIIIIKANGNLKIGLKNNSIDVVLLYDVLHLIDDREKLYKEVYKVLQDGGLFSVYPKHNKFDSPGWGLKNMTPKDIKNEIGNCGFYFEKEYCTSLSHNESINKGCVLNFRKT
jgi:ubiquinone/menaquinone biosynthesis C-methylase UbiE